MSQVDLDSRPSFQQTIPTAVKNWTSGITTGEQFIFPTPCPMNSGPMQIRMRQAWGTKPVNTDIRIQPMIHVTASTYSEEQGELTREITVTGYPVNVPQVPATSISYTTHVFDVPIPAGYMWKHYIISYITNATTTVNYGAEVIVYSTDPILARQNVDRSIIIV
ncbi:MAG: hypothetical protein NWF07_02195 [Candidatus Bathyarchaeota archaeon]|nr:hypothetical protein [Candidatus Bathyarchaeota archaeon]